MTQVGAAIDEILSKLGPLRESGVVCRQISESAGNAGILSPTASIAVIYSGDFDFGYSSKSGLSEHSYQSEFLFMGRVNQLFGADGLYHVRDLLYKLILGQRLTGYSGQLMPIQFQLTGQEQGRTETYWGFTLFTRLAGFQSDCIEGDRLAKIDRIEGIDEDVKLLRAIFEGTAEQNPVNVYAGTPALPGSNPCD